MIPSTSTSSIPTRVWKASDARIEHFEALDVGGGIRLGVPQALRLGQRVGVPQALGVHRVEDEVRGPVDDAHDLGDPVAGQGLAQAVDDGDGAGDGGLVVQIGSRGGGGLVQLGAVGREQGLVPGDHGGPLAQGPQHQGAGRFDAADELDDQVHAVDGRGGIGGEQGGVDLHVAGGGGVADQDGADGEPGAGALGEVRARGFEDSNDLAADGSGS